MKTVDDCSTVRRITHRIIKYNYLKLFSLLITSNASKRTSVGPFDTSTASSLLVKSIKCIRKKTKRKSFTRYWGMSRTLNVMANDTTRLPKLTFNKVRTWKLVTESWIPQSTHQATALIKIHIIKFITKKESNIILKRIKFQKSSIIYRNNTQNRKLKTWKSYHKTHLFQQYSKSTRENLCFSKLQIVVSPHID